MTSITYNLFPLRHRLAILYRTLAETVESKADELCTPVMVRRYRIITPGKCGLKEMYTFTQSTENSRELIGESAAIYGQRFLFKRKHLVNPKVFEYIGEKELNPATESLPKSILKRLKSLFK